MAEKNIRISIGTDNFKELVTNKDVFVDKSLFIQEVIDSGDKSMLITRPRRWGKTLNLDMLKTFLEPESVRCLQEESDSLNKSSTDGSREEVKKIGSSETKCNKNIFQPLKISKVNDGSYMQHQGQYPVIFISLNDVVGDSKQKIENLLQEKVASLFSKYEYLQKSTKLSELQKENFNKCLRQDFTQVSLENSIKFLSELLHNHHGQKVYILVDEYDKPINNLLNEYLGNEKNEESGKLIKDITNLISQTLCTSISKTNPHLEKLVLTGIFDTLQKEFGSGCNNVSIYGISDINFSKSFGFSEEEVRELLSKFEFNDQDLILKKIKDWYNGYLVPVSINETAHAYTPWAVMKYLYTAHTTKDFQPRSYWTQSGASTILQVLLTKEACVKSTLSEKLLSIAKQESAELKFDQQLSLFRYDWFLDTDNEKFFSYLLLNSGYFTVERDGKSYKFSIPNAELLEEFTSVIPNEKEQCRDVLYNLQKTSQHKLLEMIKKKDAQGISQELSENHIRCEDYSINFNFFHLSAMFGDATIFKVFLESQCGKSFAFSSDKVGGLLPLDYAYMTDNTETLTVIKEYNSDADFEDITLKPPGMLMSTMCFLYQSSLSSGSASGAIDFAKDLSLEAIGVKQKANLLAHILSSVGVSVASSSIEDQCSQYSEYKDLDITNPKDFNSLKHFEKYILEQEGKAIMVVNGECQLPHEKLAELSCSIFENSFYGDEVLKFTLCGEAQIDRDDL